MLEVIALIFLFILIQFYTLPPIFMLFLVILFLPSLYQGFLNAPFVPFPNSNLDKIFNTLNQNFKLKNKTFVDLGCGDARALIKAKKFDMISSGFEISYLTYLFAKYKTLKFENLKVNYGNFWNVELSEYDFIYIFMQKKPMQEFYEKKWPKLKKGQVVISAAFRMHGLKPTIQENGYYIYVK